jgi:hypothetical protein
MNTLLNQTPCTVSIITGFAYLLQCCPKLLEMKTHGSNRAYLFSYESPLRDRYLGDLMSLVLDATTSSRKDLWIKKTALQYIENPIVKREEFFKKCSLYFSVEKVPLPDDIFDHSTLNPEGILLGREVCHDNITFFERLLEEVCRRESSGDKDRSTGTIFTSRE